MKQQRKGFSWVKVEKGIGLIDQYGFFIVGGLVMLATLLWLLALDGTWYRNIHVALFYALQFIFLSKEVHETIAEKITNPVGPCLEFCLYFTQFAIPVCASSTVFAKLFHDNIHPYLKRITVNHCRGHHVIVSYGAFGQALYKALSDTKHPGNGNRHIVAIDNLGAGQDDETNLTLLLYDALKADISKEANLKSASAVYLMLPDEKNNLDLLEKIRCHVAANARLRVYLRTQSYAMQQLLMDQVGIGTFKRKGLDIRSSNPYAVAARGIVNRYSPDLYAPTDKSGPVSQIVMVVGASEMAKALVLRFARIGIYAPKGKLKLIWAGQGVTASLNELKASFPAIETDDGEIGFWSHEKGVSKNHFNSLLPPIRIVLEDKPLPQVLRTETIPGESGTVWPSAIYLCHNSDIRNLAEAREIQATLCSKPEAAEIKMQEWKPRLILAIQNRSVLGIADNKALEALPYRIEELCIDMLFAKTIVDDRADDLAKGYHAVYAKTSDESIDEEWAGLSPFLKETNRDIADHLAIKARYAGIDAETVSKVVFEGTGSVSEAERQTMETVYEELVELEMHRYRAFMFMNGFRHGTHAQKYLTRIEASQYLPDTAKELDRCLRVNLTLLADNLPKNESDKDDSIIKQSMAALEKRSSSRKASG